jgi:outer membrane murein-binding lipoprotein Lpp
MAPSSELAQLRAKVEALEEEMAALKASVLAINQGRDR